jgi:hypothetical protein
MFDMVANSNDTIHSLFFIQYDRGDFARCLIAPNSFIGEALLRLSNNKLNI